MPAFHHDEFSPLVNQGQLSRQRAYQLRHLLSGLCVKCTQPRVTKNHCLTHAVYERDRQRRHNQAIDEYESLTRKLQRSFTPPSLEQLPAL